MKRGIIKLFTTVLIVVAVTWLNILPLLLMLFIPFIIGFTLMFPIWLFVFLFCWFKYGFKLAWKEFNPVTMFKDLFT